MKALSLDTALTCITVSAKNGEDLVSLTLDIGMRQSEKLLPAIDYVLSQTGLTPAMLDYTVLTSGPGSFTGLRLGFAALKAIEAAHGVPVYAVNTLDSYAAPYQEMLCYILCIIDAHKDKFYAKAFLRGTETISCDDYELKTLVQRIEQTAGENAVIFTAGPEAPAFIEACENNSLLSDKKLICTQGRVFSPETLFRIAEEKIEKKEPSLKEYDGPEYFRASEAEQNLTCPKA